VNCIARVDSHSMSYHSSVAAVCFMNRVQAQPSWSFGSENYCYTKGSCYGDKIPALSGELLMTKTHCCESLRGASWGSLYTYQCELCSQITHTDLSLHASSKCITIIIIIIIKIESPDIRL